MIYVISDLHGYPHERFLALLNKAGFCEGDFIYIIGDIVDRNGDGGIATLKWLLYQPNAQLILGNHEAMLLACSFVFDEIDESFENKMTAEKLDMLQRYMADGGDVTLEAMQKLSRDEQQDILEYLRDCPLYEALSIEGKDFILVHAGLGNFSPEKHMEDYTVENLIWEWPELTDKYYDGIITVFGHTPTLSYGEKYKDKIIKTPTWIDIDMGAGFGREPVLLRLDDMAEFRMNGE